MAAELFVVYLKVRHRATQLTPPAVTTQDLRDSGSPLGGAAVYGRERWLVFRIGLSRRGQIVMLKICSAAR
jgi:hypothetical protein